MLFTGDSITPNFENQVTPECFSTRYFPAHNAAYIFAKQHCNEDRSDIGCAREYVCE